jgi:hypothetical protein
MKNYRQLIRELPSKTVVMAVGSFNPPTAVNEMTFKLVKKLVESHNAEHVIFITENKNDLPADRKIHFLNLMFNGLNFVPLTEGNLVEEIGGLKSRYKNVVVVTSEEKSKLFESMSVVTAPVDSNASKIKSYVTKGDYTSFKAAMPTSFRDIDARRLMNEMRQSYGLELLKEDVRFSIDALRDKYFKGEIYQVGDIVESAGSQYEIMDRGSNYLVVVDNKGDLHRKWVKDVSLVEAVKKPTGPLKKACWKGYTAVGLKKKNGRMVPNCVPESVLNPADPHKDYAEKSKTLQDLSRNKDVDQKVVQQRRLDLDKEYGKLKEEVFSYKGYVPKNLNSELVEAFKLAAIDSKDPVAMLNAIKTTDTYLQLHGKIGDNPDINQLKTYKDAHIKATEALQKIGVYDANEENPDTKLARNVLTYQDFMKAGKEDVPENPEKYVGEPHTTPGHTLATRNHLRRQKVQYATEEVQIDEDAKSLKAQADKHTEHAVAANKAGDDDKVRYHQAQVAKIKAKLSKLTEESIDEISQKVAGSYLDKVTKQELSKHGMQHDMYGKLSKNRQKGVANAFKRLEIDKEGKPVHHLVSKEDYIKGDLMDEDFASKFYAEGNGGEIGDGIGDEKIKKVKTLPPNLVKNDDKRLGGGTRDHTFSAFMEKQKVKTKENADYKFTDLMKHQQTGE